MKSFSKIYLQKTDPVADSKRARVRFAALFSSVVYISDRTIADNMQFEFGVIVNRSPSGDRFYFNKFILSCEMRDLLDLITVVHDLFVSRDEFERCEDWVAGSERIFREEGLPYTVDQDGVVHHYIDEEFRQLSDLTLTGLNDSRWNSAKLSFKSALTALDKHPQDNIQAIRCLFDACENVFKQLSGESRLGATGINKKLIPLIESRLSGSSLHASKLYAKAFSEWVNAAHNFRHADGQPEPRPPDDHLTIALVSAGAGYLRWLVGLDNAPGT